MHPSLQSRMREYSIKQDVWWKVGSNTEKFELDASLKTKILQHSGHSAQTGCWWMVIHSSARTQGHWLVPKMLTINHGPKASSIRWLVYPQAELLVLSALVCCASIQDPVKSMVLTKVFASCKSFKCQIRKPLIYSISIMFIKQI